MNRGGFLSQERAASCLQLVQFYLPRVLAAGGSGPPPELWWYALALQQLGDYVLDMYSWWCQQRDCPISAEVLDCQRSLERLRRRWWARNHALPGSRSLRQQAADWPHAQQHLRRTIPLVERLLKQAAQAA